MKKLGSLLLAAVLLAGILTGCQSSADQSSDKLTIVTTIFPAYDWVMQVLGSKGADADVTMLLDNGVDLHSYQPTTDDMIKISTCDLFIYVGGESDEWVDNALNDVPNENRIVIDLLDVLGDGAKEEELVEGMDAEEEHGEEAGETEYDEHVWLSLKNASLFVSAIRDALVSLDGESSDTYASQADAYIEQLRALDTEYQSAVDAAPVKTLLFGDRFPFRYLTEDYGLDYFAAFSGCSAESEASFETIAFLAGKVDELGLSAVLTLEGTSQKIAETVVSASAGKNARILSLDSMQSTTSREAEQGASYLAIMEKNLDVLKDALQ